MRVGSVEVPVYQTPSRGFPGFTVAWRHEGKRHRERFPTLAKAKKAAEIKAEQIASGELGKVEFSAKQAAEFVRALESCDGTPIEQVAGEWSRARKAVHGVTLDQLADFWNRHHPKDVPRRTVQEALAEFLEAKGKAHLSSRYLTDLRNRLRQFGYQFGCPVTECTGPRLVQWFDSLRVGPRSKNNTRGALHTFFGWCRRRGYLPREWSELDAVDRLKTSPKAKVVLSPEELLRLLNEAKASRERLVAFLAVGAFAGLRSSEIERLRWSDVLFDRRLIQVDQQKGRSASRRLVPISRNLREWLVAYRGQGHAPVCPYRNVPNELRLLAERCGMEWKHNGLRHSFISYRVALTGDVARTALEAGNSPGIVQSNYRELVTKSQAQRWFGIAPDSPTVAKVAAR